MKIIKVLFVSILFSLAFNSCTDLEDDNLDTTSRLNIQSTGDISQDNGSKP
ncbi:hypothetical protein [Polaribacter sp.]|uniref:hypothetical protein n=1 Tax=Polaribacter sp. TaxID=1920175 RepID=UPI003EF15025